LRAVVFRAPAFRVVFRAPVDLRRVVLRAVVFRAPVFRAVVLRAPVFRAVVFRAVDFRAVLLRPVDFLAVLLPVALFAGGTVTTFPSLDWLASTRGVPGA
jgi:hypothetical protein